MSFKYKQLFRYEQAIQTALHIILRNMNAMLVALLTHALTNPSANINEHHCFVVLTHVKQIEAPISLDWHVGMLAN